MAHTLFTIGHSNIEIFTFLEMLQSNGVTTLVDVRSRPQSFHHPQFSQPQFEQAVKAAGFAYMFLGEELGGRPEDAEAYREDGRVDYRRRRKSFGFQQGLERVLSELQNGSLALLCAEEDPITCHRFLMIGPALLAAGIEPHHIRKTGEVESQRDAEDRMLRENNFADVSSGALFDSDRSQALEEAYERQAEKCAFRAIQSPSTVDY